MSDTEPKRILIVTGDYALVHKVRQLLDADSFAIQTAYSHMDGAYTLENGEFDAVLVEAGMADRRSGDSTAFSLARLCEHVPVIAVAADGRVPSRSNLPPNLSFTRLEERAIQRSLSAALRIPIGLNTAVFDNSGAPVAEEIQTLFNLSKSLTEVLDLTEVLNRVVEAARRLTHAEEGMILLPDDEAGQLYLRAKVGIDVEVARNFRVKTEDTLAGDVFLKGQPVLIGAQGPQKVKTEYLVNALLYVPIIYKGACIGVLGVNNKNTEAVFHPRHLDLLANLASFAAVAIENARAHEEVLERTRELQMLVEASHAVNASVSLDRTLPTVCEQLARVLNVHRAEIYEWNPETSRLSVQARFFRTIWPVGQGPVIDLASRSLVRVSLTEGMPVLALRDDPELAPGEQEYLCRVGAGMMVVVPIIGGSQVLGAAQLGYIAPPQRMPDGDVWQRAQHLALEVLVTFSNQTGAARAQGLLRAVEEINRLTGADWCDLALFTPDKQALTVHLSVGSGVWLGSAQPGLDLPAYPDLLEALRSHTPINKQADSKMMSSGIRALMDVAQGRSILGLPLVQRGQASGLVLFVDARRSRVFDQHDLDLAGTMVAQAATALENARLVHDLERSLIELRETQDRLVQTARLSAMGELAAVVAHQINNPLTTIMVDSEMLLLDEPKDSRNYASLLAINRAGKRASGVARRLLAISRPDKPDNPPQPIDVVDTIDGVLSLVKAHIERDRIRVVAELPDERLPSVWAVQGQLDDIWLNLVMNAHDALVGREGATIWIQAEYLPEQSLIEVRVADNGPGIPPHLVEEVFKPFFTTKPVGEGTGLGLHICRQTAERVGGSITVETLPNEGTTFFVRLPVKKGTD
ncbi:MAG: GAF domain-containing protein [Chloroflexi bacterium]|nr:GAF domain-containing protein [Chloroflexota bacterium]